MFHRMGKFIVALLILTGVVWAEQINQKGEPIALTESGNIYMAPKWSPQGTQLAVSGVKYEGVYLVSFPSGEIKTLTEHAGAGYGLAWSPAGNAIAVRASSYENYFKKSQILVLNLDGSENELTPKTTSLTGVPAWTDAGDHVYLKSGTQFKSFATRSARSALSGSITYMRDLGIYQRDLETGSETLISEPGQRVLYLAISPNKDKLIFSTTSEQLWIADMDGSNQKNLGRGTAPDWSPNGKWIVCMTTEDDGHVFTSTDIVIYEALTGTSSQLTKTPDIHEMNPVWSPDGKWIAYDNERDGRIWAIEVEEK